MYYSVKKGENESKSEAMIDPINFNNSWTCLELQPRAVQQEGSWSLLWKKQESSCLKHHRCPTWYTLEERWSQESRLKPWPSNVTGEPLTRLNTCSRIPSVGCHSYPWKHTFLVDSIVIKINKTNTFCVSAILLNYLFK